MSIQLINKQKFKEKFRLLENPRKIILGLMHEPPEDIRYSNNMYVRMMETAHEAFELIGKQIQYTGKSRAIYSIGSYISLRNDKLHRVYQATHLNQQWTRQVKKMHPVTKLETSDLIYVDLGKIHVTVLHSTYTESGGFNPTQKATMVSVAEIKPADIVGDFLIREVRLEYGLYYAQAEYNTVKPNGL